MQNLKIKIQAIIARILGTYDMIDCSSSADFGKVFLKATLKDCEFYIRCEYIERLRDAAKEQRNGRASLEQQEDLPL